MSERQPENFPDAQKAAPTPASERLPAVNARVRLVVRQHARNAHVLFAERAFAEKTPGAAPLWPVRLTAGSNATYAVGTVLECRHLGAGYYEFDPQKHSQWPIADRPSEPQKPS